MDKSWVNSRMFSKEHVDGVHDFMTFVSQRFNDDEEILCPCRRCLNRVRGPIGQVEDHLYIHGMASTYTRWILHGEPLEVVLHENEDHVDDHASLNEDFGINVDEEDDPHDGIHGLNEDFGMNVDEEDDPDDGIYGMVGDLYTAEEEGKRKKSMFAVLLKEMKQELYPNAQCSRFSFLVEMEEKAAAPPQGQDTVTPTQAVLQVMPKSTFLRNIGMQPAKIDTKAAAFDARVQELENELVAEKEESAAVRAQVRAELEEERAARKKVEEEHEMLKKQIGKMHGFFRSFLGTQPAPSQL